MPVLLALVAAQPLRAQAKPSFEAATIKPTAVDPDTIPKFRSDPGRLAYTNVTLRDCIKIAWRLQDNQLEAPKFTDGFRFDLAATVSGSASEDTMRLMLRNLLIERFAMTVHEETRDLPLYELRVAGKLKLTRSESGEPFQKTWQAGRIGFVNATMEQFAQALSESTGRPVSDRTGLAGAYSFSIEISDDPMDAKRIMRGNEVGDLIVASLQSQLGLRLQPHKGPVTVLVVDRAEKFPRDH